MAKKKKAEEDLSESSLDEIVEACVRMSEKRTGALICLRRRDSFADYAQSGQPIDAIVSSDLIRTLFFCGTPLHDGALLIDDNRLTAAACTLPLTKRRMPSEVGFRHKAAIGLSEETDGLIVVVSEETGEISVAYNGEMERVELDNLRARLLSELSQ